MTVRVLVADDHALMREGLRFILARAGITVVGEAGTGREALEAVRCLTPDVVLMDISMPDLNGIEVTRAIIAAGSATRVVILSMHATSEHVFQALKAGASAYVVKEAAGEEVVEAVRAVAGGRRFVSRSIAAEVLQASTRSGSTASHPSPLERLSTRERQVVQLVAEGRSSADIAEMLHLSRKSVETYRSRTLTKLGLSSTVQLVKFAVQHGLTDLE